MAVHVVAIDFGTTYSGYAFSVTEPDLKLEEVQILAYRNWQCGATSIMTHKAPTCVLIERGNKSVVAFGYDAETQYAELKHDGKQDHYYFFHRFKMELHSNKNITCSMPLIDDRQQTLPAIEVFGLSIKALKNHLSKTLKDRYIELSDERTKWVLTVPSIWTEPVKQFMRESAKFANIPENMLKIALEPEAASIYCQIYPSPGSTDITRTGSKYMIVDLGGGTVDITVHEKLFDGSLKELARSTGGASGGMCVDNEFKKMLVSIFGKAVLDKLKLEFPFEHLSLESCFESVKRTLTPSHTEYINITIPAATLGALCSSELKRDIKDVIKSFCHLDNSSDVINFSDSDSSSGCDTVKLLGDKLRIKPSFALSLFKSSCDEIVTLIRSYLDKDNCLKFIDILLVGGFAECKVIQNRIQNEFKGHRVILQEDASTIVLKGAVLFGYKQDIISYRTVRSDFGISVSQDFDKNKHNEQKKTFIEGKAKCKNVFDCFVKTNTSLPLTHKIKKTYYTVTEFQKSCLYQVYFTDKRNVMYTDDGNCTLVGEHPFEIPNPTKHYREMTALFQFGDTELSVTIEDVESKFSETIFFKIKN